MVTRTTRFALSLRTLGDEEHLLKRNSSEWTFLQ
jgi:hypothetical protein